MKGPLACCLLLVVSASGEHSSDSAAATPLGKVLTLLSNMLKKAEEAKQQEAAQWSAYRQFCTDTDLVKQDEIKAADVQLEVLKAAVEKLRANIARLETEIQGHQTDIEGFKSDLNSSTVERRMAHVDYQRLHQDLRESIEALGKAIQVLQQQARDHPQTSSLLQQAAAVPLLPKAARRVLQAFLERDSDEPDLVFVAPDEAKAKAYKFQSQSVLNLLKELLEKFKTEKTQLEKKELGERHAQEMLALGLTHSSDAAEHEIAKKTKSMSQAKQAEADTSAQHQQLSTTRADSAQYLEDLRATCQQKADDYDARQKLRTEEIEALEKAHALLSSYQVAAVAEKHLPSLMQRGRPAPSFVQKHSQPQGESQEKAASFLKGESERLGSRVLSALAEHAQVDPFAKVKKMIEDLISKLQEQSAAEAQHKDWCDTELNTNAQTRQAKTTQVESLHSTIEQRTAEVSILKKDIAMLSKDVAQLEAALIRETDIRTEEKARNEDTIAEAVSAQMELSQAIKILKEFYAKAADATVLAQRGQRDQQAPPIFDAPYQGQQKDKDNVVAFLEVLHSDFARLETETSAAERAAQAEHDRFVEDTGKEKDEKNKAVAAKQKEVDTKEQELETAKRDLDMAQSELDAALAYYDKLRPSCLTVGTESSAAERVQRREEEIASLREALAILSGESLPDFGPKALYSSVEGGNRGMEVGITAGD